MLEGVAREGRTYAADDVYDALAREILSGDLTPEEPLPPERALSDRFGVSKLLVRQAIHRLREAGLVRVRQGDVTRVLDPMASCSLRVIELYYRLAPEVAAGRTFARHVLEKQYTQGLSLVEVFARRASKAARRSLVTKAAEASAARDEKELASFERRFWTAVAEGGENRILVTEVGFWYRVLPARPEMPTRPTLAARRAFYVELARRLAEGDAPVSYYVETLGPGVSALFTTSKRGGR